MTAKGTYVSADGDTYAGRFQNGHYQGRGPSPGPTATPMQASSGTTGWRGEGTFTLRKGERYAGRFKDNEMNGEGVYTWPNGDQYKGGFRDDTMNGQGGIRLRSRGHAIRRPVQGRQEGR